MDNIRHISEPWEVSAERPEPSLDGVVKWLRGFLAEIKTVREIGLPEEPMIDALRAMIREKPGEWWLGHHFGWGMWMRNQLRTNGFGEKELGVGNLDDYYVPLVERACAIEIE